MAQDKSTNNKIFIGLLVVTCLLAVYQFGLSGNDNKPDAIPARTPENMEKNKQNGDSGKVKRSSRSASNRTRQDKGISRNRTVLRTSQDLGYDDVNMLEKEILSSIDKWNLPKLELMLRSLSTRGEQAMPVFLELLTKYPYLRRLEFYINQVQNASHFAQFRDLYNSAGDERTRRILVGLLGNNKNPEATAFLINEINKDLPYGVSTRVVNALAGKNSPEATAALLDILDKYRDHSLGKHIVQSLSEKQDPAVARKFFELISSGGSTSLRYNALHALGTVGDKSMVENLVKLLPFLDETPLKQAAYSALGELMNNRALAVLLTMTEDKDAGLPDISTILAFDDARIFDTVKTFLDQGKFEKQFELTGIIEYLGTLQSGEATEILKSIYNNDELRVNRVSLINALGKTPSEENLDFLSRILKESNPEYLRWTSLNALKENFRDSAVPVLAEVVRRKDNMAIPAYDAIMEIGGPEALDIMDQYEKRVRIQSIIKDSQASSIGLQPGDIIRAYNKNEVANVNDLQHEVSHASMTEAAELEIERNGETISFVINGGSIGIYMKEYLDSLDG